MISPFSRRLPLLLLLWAGGIFCSTDATTLPPELQAYDFGEAYYLEDGGVVISPYADGFYTSSGIETPEGIRIMPGGTFSQFDESRFTCHRYRLLRLNESGTRAFFRRIDFRYHVSTDVLGRVRRVLDQQIGTDDFYLTRFRSLEWFDHAFPYLDLHPTTQTWRTRAPLGSTRLGNN